MKSENRLVRQLLPAALMISGAAIFSFGSTVSGFQGSKRLPGTQPAEPPAAAKRNSRPEQSEPAATTDDTARADVRYAYEFSQPQFVIRHIVIEHDESGRGKMTFEKLGEESSIVEPIQLSATALAKITGLWQALHFIDSDTNYQSDKQFAHLGTMKLRMEQGTRKRTAEFNWTHDENASALVNEYRRVADQAILIFDISVARENQPLDAPKLMEQLEYLIKRSGLSDPRQLVPLLNEITTDEHLPLIARNHAKRLLKQISPR